MSMSLSIVKRLIKFEAYKFDKIFKYLKMHKVNKSSELLEFMMTSLSIPQIYLGHCSP